MIKRKDFLPYALPAFDEREEGAVVEAIRSGWWSRGPKTLEFEKRFAEYVGAKYALAVNSCTAAMHLALIASDIGPGDEVITSAMTFCSTVNVIINSGATPVLADIDPETGLIDPDDVERKITEKTRAIMPVHYAGRACDLDRIGEIAEKHGLVVIEDAAHATGTKYKGKMIGSSGNLTAFSFYATKNLATGEGGMLTTDSAEIYEKARVYSLHGMSRNAWNRYSKGGSWHYDVEYPGFKYNMTDLTAAIGLVQLDKVSDFNATRARYAEYYEEQFKDVPEITTLKEAPGSENSWHLYIIWVDETKLTVTRDVIIDTLTNEYNIGLSVHFIPIPCHPCYKEAYGMKKEDYPNTARLFKGLISLPLYPSMKEEDVRYVAEAVREVTRRFAK
ncbi:MAG: DegT/DnrJ/EryC1/StrS family aminotransferase [Clostridia bacterium]|nr:DegT/DnrJ/EryC1/StrS family aminotransferase [Clostridia bacterium]